MTTHAMEKVYSGDGAVRLHRAGEETDPDAFRARRRTRRKRLAEQLADGSAKTRYFPVLSVLAPVMTQSEGKSPTPATRCASTRR